VDDIVGPLLLKLPEEGARRQLALVHTRQAKRKEARQRRESAKETIDSESNALFRILSSIVNPVLVLQLLPLWTRIIALRNKRQQWRQQKQEKQPHHFSAPPHLGASTTDSHGQKVRGKLQRRRRGRASGGAPGRPSNVGRQISNSTGGKIALGGIRVSLATIVRPVAQIFNRRRRVKMSRGERPQPQQKRQRRRLRVEGQLQVQSEQQAFQKHRSDPGRPWQAIRLGGLLFGRGLWGRGSRHGQGTTTITVFPRIGRDSGTFVSPTPQKPSTSKQHQQEIRNEKNSRENTRLLDGKRSRGRGEHGHGHGQ